MAVRRTREKKSIGFAAIAWMFGIYPFLCGMERKANMTIRLEVSAIEALERIASEDKRSVSNLVAVWITQKRADYRNGAKPPYHPVYQDDDAVVFPKVYWHATTRHVLGLEEIKGVMLSNLKEGQLSPEERRRIVDFLFGVIHAVDGDVCRVDDTVFIFTPNRISIDAPDAEVARRAMGSTIPLRSHPLRQQAM